MGNPRLGNAMPKAISGLIFDVAERKWLISIMYAHALRVSEACDLRWNQVDLKDARLKNGAPSVHYLEDEELRALRQLRRDHPDSDFVFNSQRQGPLSTRQVYAIVARAGIAAGMKFPVPFARGLRSYATCVMLNA